MKTIVSDTVTNIIQQAGLDERFRADFEKSVAAVYAAGVESAATVVKSVPLTDAEIAAFRDSLRS
jgi:hypothetical protein